MEIRSKKIKDIIIPLFEGIVNKEDTIIEVFLKETPDKTYIKLYCDDNKVVLSEKYADENYWLIKAYVQSELKHNPEKNIRDLTIEDLENLSEEIKEEMKHIWFSADFHQGHKPMAESLWEGIDRPTTMDNHDDWLINIINSRVGKKDKFFILGDVSMQSKKEAEKFLMKLNGDKTLIFGNHDKNLKNSNVISEKLDRKEFKFRREGIDIFIVLDHYPMMSWNRSVHGSWQLFGHVHGRLQVHDKLMFDVGIDNTELKNHQPHNLWEISNYMINKRILISEMLKC